MRVIEEYFEGKLGYIALANKYIVSTLSILALCQIYILSFPFLPKPFSVHFF